MLQRKRVFFLVLPHVHLLDLSGPVQAFYEADQLGGAYEVRFVSNRPQLRSAQGLCLAELEPLPVLNGDDTVVIPGMDSSTLETGGDYPVAWLQDAHASGCRLASVCSAAFVLADCGLLDGRRCTTHWKIREWLRRRRPACKVLDGRLFVDDDNLITSAGVASGIDMALFLIERDFGPMVVGKVCREMVVYRRRHAESPQQSVYLDFRNHLHLGVHRVQDFLIQHPNLNPTIDDLAETAAMSARNLTRVFKKETGITLKQFMHRLKLEVAESLMANPDYTFERIAREVGFRHPRQLRRLWKERHGVGPAMYRTTMAEKQRDLYLNGAIHTDEIC